MFSAFKLCHLDRSADGVPGQLAGWGRQSGAERPLYLPLHWLFVFALAPALAFLSVIPAGDLLFASIPKAFAPKNLSSPRACAKLPNPLRFNNIAEEKSLHDNSTEFATIKL
jgi:hypothetical protein